MSTKVQVLGGAAQPIYIMGPGIDDEGILINIAWEHHLVHEGKMFQIEHSASVTNGNNLDIRLFPGIAAATALHVNFSVNTGGQVTIYLYESPTQSAGTALTEVNMNRKSARTLSWSFTHTPTVGAVGSTPLINGRLLPGGATQQTRVGGTARPGTEFELHPAKEYLLRITNTSGSTIVINPVFEVYEE